MPASYTISSSVPRNTRRSKPASTPSTCFPIFSINLFMAFPLPLVICLPTQQTSYGNRKRHHRLVAAMPRYADNDNLFHASPPLFCCPEVVLILAAAHTGAPCSLMQRLER